MNDDRTCQQLKEIVIRLQLENDPMPWHLLLDADPSKELVETYLQQGFTFVADLDRKVIGVLVIVITGDTDAEIKNIAVDIGYRGRGVGRLLLQYAITFGNTHNIERLIIGTADCSFDQLKLYQSAGFVVYGTRKNFFIENYPEPIFENDIRAKDMVMLEMILSQ